MRIKEIANQNIEQQAIATPKASLVPTPTLAQQKQVVQRRKVQALAQQYANSELAQQGKVTDLDKVKAMMAVGDMRRG